MASSSNVTLDDLESSTSTITNLAIDNHLHYPTVNTEEPATEEVRAGDHQPRQILKDRLYIGNLHPTVDEYSLLQLFSKFGKVTKLDYLFHKTGPLKGKPRGYAFVEYGNPDDARRALTMAHEKLLRGRKLIVTFAQQAPLDQYSGAGMSSTQKNRKTMMETGRPTTLSMLKTGASGRREGKTEDKIAMMEAKLRQMEATNPKPAKPTSPSVDSNVDDAHPFNASSSSSSSLPYHPSLPMKPPPPLPAHLNIQRPVQSNPPFSVPRPKAPLPSLPMPPASRVRVQGRTTEFRPPLPPPMLNSTSGSGASGSTTHQRPAKSSKLIGVRIKPKEKEKTKP